jgi:hypothetical protein
MQFFLAPVPQEKLKKRADLNLISQWEADED